MEGTVGAGRGEGREAASGTRESGAGLGIQQTSRSQYPSVADQRIAHMPHDQAQSLRQFGTARAQRHRSSAHSFAARSSAARSSLAAQLAVLSLNRRPP